MFSRGCFSLFYQKTVCGRENQEELFFVPVLAIIRKEDSFHGAARGRSLSLILFRGVASVSLVRQNDDKITQKRGHAAE